LADRITLRQYGRDCFITMQPTEEDCAAARAGLAEVRRVVHSGRYQLVVLDEINIATHYQLFPVASLLELLAQRPEGVELVLTGRMADPQVVAVADLVTEMKEIKHYYQRGVAARDGIEK
jgi:cob(I)alamin adenosyltransferase